MRIFWSKSNKTWNSSHSASFHSTGHSFVPWKFGAQDVLDWLFCVKVFDYKLSKMRVDGCILRSLVLFFYFLMLFPYSKFTKTQEVRLKERKEGFSSGSDSKFICRILTTLSPNIISELLSMTWERPRKTNIVINNEVWTYALKFKL